MELIGASACWHLIHIVNLCKTALVIPFHWIPITIRPLFLTRVKRNACNCKQQQQLK